MKIVDSRLVRNKHDIIAMSKLLGCDDPIMVLGVNDNVAVEYLPLSHLSLRLIVHFALIKNLSSIAIYLNSSFSATEKIQAYTDAGRLKGLLDLFDIELLDYLAGGDSVC